jgi:hypothetical protein
MNLSNFAFPKEPAIWIAAANAVLVLLITFGVPINSDQKVAIDGVLGTVLALAAGFAIRTQVSPALPAAPKPIILDTLPEEAAPH